MKTGIARLLEDLQGAVVAKADACEVKDKASAVIRGLVTAAKGRALTLDQFRGFKRACVDMSIEGYTGEAIYAEGGAELGNLMDVPSWGEDMEKWEKPWPQYVSKATGKAYLKPSTTAKIEKDHVEGHPEDCDCKDCRGDSKGDEKEKEEDRKDERKKEEDARRVRARDKEEEHEEDEEEKKDKEYMRKMREEDEHKKEEDARMKSIDKELEDAEKDSEEMKDMDEKDKEHAKDHVRKFARDASSVRPMLESYLATYRPDSDAAAADARLKAMGIDTERKGKVFGEDFKASVTVNSEAKPWKAMVDKMCLMADDMQSSLPGQLAVNPNSRETIARRTVNRKRLEPVIDHFIEQMAGRPSAEVRKKFATDAASGNWEAESALEKASADWFDAISHTLASGSMRAASDATSMSNLWTQPTIAEWYLIQSFQDLEQLPNIRVIPPNGANGANWLRAGLQGAHVGSTIRIMSEYWVDGLAYTFQNGSYDAGGVYGTEGTAIEYGSVNDAWQEYGSFQRQFGFAVNMSTILQTGHGPLHYPAVMRSLFHTAARMSRARDKALADEQFNFAAEYNATIATSEVYGTTPLADNSVGPASGAVTVNLNTTKTAVTAVAPNTGNATADPYVTYAASVPSGSATGATAIVAALRLKCGGNGTSSPYVGTATGIGQIVRPRTTYTISAVGQTSTSTTNPISISSPASQVLGNYDPVNKVIIPIPGGAAPTFAIDYGSSTVVFNSTAGLTLSGGVITTSTTITYTYATNFDSFVVDPTYYASTISTTDPATYINGLVRQFDFSAAALASAPSNYVKPDLFMCAVTPSAWFLGASVFYKLNSPKGTELFPEELYFAERNGIDMQRINAPWNGTNNWGLISRRQVSFLALDTPMQVRGPIDVQNNGILNQLAYIAYEREVINTAVPTNQSGTIINQPSRLLRMYNAQPATY